MSYFYPGYFVPGYKPFNYKLEIGKAHLQFWCLREQCWKAIQEIDNELLPLNEMTQKLETIKHLFIQQGRECHLLRYDFFDANLVPHLRDSQLFDYPIFLYPFDLTEDAVFPVIVFDIFEGCYQLLQMRSVWVSNSPLNNTEVYSSHVLKVDKIIFSSRQPQDMVMLLNLMLIKN